MKELIIHIGYPKTATTTLQNSLFVKLQKLGKISYLGRADFSPDFFKDNRNFAKEFRSAVFQNFNSINFDFAKEAPFTKVILSDEGLTMPSFYNTYLNGIDYDTEQIPAFIKKTFQPHFDIIKVMVVLRNQADLLSSLYVQRYDRFEGDANHNDPENHFFDEQRNFKTEYFKVFNFYDVLKGYEDVFDKENIKVLLYEELLNSPDIFVDELAAYLNMDKSLVQESMARKKMNTTVSLKGKKVRKKRVKSYPFQVYYKVFRPLFHTFGLHKLLPTAIKKKAFEVKPIIVPELRPWHLEKIRATYSQSNLKIANYYNIREDKLNKYGYI